VRKPSRSGRNSRGKNQNVSVKRGMGGAIRGLGGGGRKRRMLAGLLGAREREELEGSCIRGVLEKQSN